MLFYSAESTFFLFSMIFIGLNLTEYASEGNNKVTYDLYGVSNHSGGVHSGHYTAICKHPYSGEWHEFNDTRCVFFFVFETFVVLALWVVVV